MSLSFKNITDHLHRKVATDRGKKVIMPDAEWRKIFLAFWILFGCVAGWSSYLYYSYALSALSSTPAAIPKEALSKESFVPVFNYFDAREKELEAAIATPPLVADPGVR